MSKPKDLELKLITMNVSSNNNIGIFRSGGCSPNGISKDEIDSTIEYLKSVKEYIEEQNKPKVGDYGLYNSYSYILIKNAAGTPMFMPLEGEESPCFSFSQEHLRFWKKEGNIYENSN